MSGRLEFRANTFVRHLKLAALDDSHSGLRSVVGDLGCVFDHFDHIVSLKDLSKHDVLSVQPRGLLDGDEELRAVG